MPLLQRFISMYSGERLNTWTHLIGLVLAVLGLALMLAKTVPSSEATKSVGALVFGIACVGMYAASALFHSAHGPAKLRWQRIDHCAIYVLIAGTYTPFALTSSQDLSGWIMLVVVWCLSAWGIWREFRATTAKPSLAFYLCMGWAAIVAASPVIAHIHIDGLIWLLVGAGFYSVGTVFYAKSDGWRHAHGIWHLFVLCGTASHYVAIVGFVA